MIYAITQ